MPIFYIHSIVLPFKIIKIALTQKWLKASGKQTEKAKEKINVFWHINLSNLKSIKTGEKPTTNLYEINIQLAVC